MKYYLLAASIAAALSIPLAEASAKDGKNAAFVGGAAAGVVGGVLLNQALQGGAQPAQPPAYIEEEQPVYHRPLRVRTDDRAFGQMEYLRDSCDRGSRKACIRFGMILGQNKEREAQWRRSRPDLYSWE